jgi:hypothetical protein
MSKDKMQDIDSEKKAGPSPSLAELRRNRSSTSTRLTILLSAVFFASALLFLVIAPPQTVKNRFRLWLDEVLPSQASQSSQPSFSSDAEGDEYLIGVGKADITG